MRDGRALVIGAIAWAAAYAGLGDHGWWAAAAGACAVATLGVIVGRRRRGAATVIAWLLAGTAAFASAAVHVGMVAHTPVREFAAQGAAAWVEATVDSTPVVTPGRFSHGVYFDATLRDITARGHRYRLRAPVLVLLPSTTGSVRRGDDLRFEATLSPSDRPERAAILSVHGPPKILQGPGPVTRATDRVRAAIRSAVANRSTSARVLVPALVDGDEAGLSNDLRDDFRTTGLTHLMAVSGTNLTLIVGFILLLARWAGVRARGLVLTGLLGVVGFVLLSGPEPSVLRAAAMGVIALVGMSAGGQERAARALGVGVLALVVLDPWLAASPGFALSTLATAGILLLAPRWRDALTGWLPRWAAEALAVPLAAQVACTPLVAAISGQVSLVAVAANLIAAPLVAPATVLGLVGGVVALVSLGLGRLLALPAAWCADGLVAIARHGADLPLPAITWSTGAAALAMLVGLCAGISVVMPWLLSRRWPCLMVAGLLAVVMTISPPIPGWPPAGWVMVACSVGQGDGLALRVGDHTAVVVDAGPDPRLMDRCLRRLSVRVVPIVVLTHFHADHVDGLSGVLHGRKVGQVLVSSLAQPVAGVNLVRRLLARSHITERVVSVGESTTVGPLRWQVLAPLQDQFPDSDSPPNDASIVMLVRVRGIRILMLADEERPSQALLRETYGTLHADVVKVAHHGSSKQDAALVDGTGARVAVISVGIDNDYGHPASSTLSLLEHAGMAVRRTDRDGDVAVVVDSTGHLGTVVLGNPH
ncbi:MAG TPA: ComEC/Rec2 family competence protein [Marmoricola sp.]|nr:ComEC/Rec2 family competence protein [Marmoricola sp.]